MKVIIVTGLSGAGKTMAMDVLEDMGYYCVDNMPPALIKNFMEIAPKKKEIEAAAFGIDVRGGSLFDDLKDTLEEMKRMDVDYKILYLEATDRVLSRRYSETRREHPWPTESRLSRASRGSESALRKSGARRTIL